MAKQTPLLCGCVMNPNNKLIDIVGILEIIWIANLGGKSRCAMIFMWFLHIYIYIWFCLFLFITLISILVCMEEANVEVHKEKAIMVSSYHLRFLTLMYY